MWMAPMRSTLDAVLFVARHGGLEAGGGVVLVDADEIAGAGRDCEKRESDGGCESVSLGHDAEFYT